MNTLNQKSYYRIWKARFSDFRIYFFGNNESGNVEKKIKLMVRLKKRQVWRIRSPIYLFEMGFIIQPTTGGLLWCAVNIWVAHPIKASAFFLCLIYCHSSSAQTDSWNRCQSTNDTVYGCLNNCCHNWTTSLLSLYFCTKKCGVNVLTLYIPQYRKWLKDSTVVKEGNAGKCINGIFVLRKGDVFWLSV